MKFNYPDFISKDDGQIYEVAGDWDDQSVYCRNISSKPSYFRIFNKQEIRDEIGITIVWSSMPLP